MPILNLAWWPVADKVAVRFNRAKTIARPPVSRLTGSSVTCTYDETQTGVGAGGEDEEGLPDMNCSGTLGNPALRPQTNINRNLSLEWYVNKDTMLSAAVFQQRGIIGAAQVVGIPNARPFAGTGATDVTGRSLDDVEFSIRTYDNMPPTSSDGLELSAKTAFTFLPSVLRYTGIDANYTKIRGKVEGAQWQDLITGTRLNPVNQQDHSWNTSLWYDDGALNMRVALQVTDQYFKRIATDDNIAAFPAPNVAGGSLPYNPGAPLFRDARRFIDFKVAYKFKSGIEVFAEGRNIGRSTVTDSTAGFQPFSNGVPTISSYTYGGAQYMVGIVLRN
jgi:TonB-dependent receptor